MLEYASRRFSQEFRRSGGLAGVGAVSIAAVAVVTCQIVAVAAGEQTGAILNACLVLGLAAAASAERGAEPSRTAYLLLSLLPLLALARLAMPQNSIPSDLWELVVAVPLVAGSVLFVTIASKRVFRVARTSCSLKWQITIAFLGAPVGLLAFGAAYGLGEREDGSGIEATTATVLFIAGVLDELLFRGVLQVSLARVYGHGAFIVAALLYTAMLLGNSAVSVVLGGLIGLGFGFLVARLNALLAVAVGHGLLNVVWLVLAPDLFLSRTSP
jgi:membrane protease YdiL (CAAX protease family)